MEKKFFVIGAMFAAIAVAGGALGSHALKHQLSPEMLAVFEIGVRYQMYHALGLIGIALACPACPGRLMRLGGWLIVCGTILFSGTLYQLTLTGTRWLGAITPIGGGLLIIGWLCAAAAAIKSSGR